MKLCANVPGDSSQKIAALRRLGLWGTGLGVDLHWSAPEARRQVEPFRAAGIAVVQVGCYRNLVATDESVRAAAIRDVGQAMELAGEMGVPAVICGGGHRHPDHAAAVFAVHPDTWSDRAIDVLVESCREIAATVSALAATLCLEPWAITTLDSPARLEEVMRRVDHPKVAVELDPVNMMTIDRYADTAGFLTECFDRLGEKIRLVHAKDTLLKPEPFTYHMSEAAPGEGVLDFRTLLELMQRLPADTPLLIEHLSDEGTIARARDYIAGEASRLGFVLT
jgi:sugar phosphate isomerase/epimerase